MNKLSTFLLGAITGAIALGVTACVCESSFGSSPSDDTTDCDEDDENADSTLNKDTVPPDSAIIMR